MSLTAAVSRLFELADLRRAAEGGDSSAIKVAAELMTSMNPTQQPMNAKPMDPGTGPQADNRTSMGNPYASQMPAGPFGRAVEETRVDPFKPITKNPLKQPKQGPTFQAGSAI